MGKWDDLGKRLLRHCAGELFTDWGPSVEINFGTSAGAARIDGTIAGSVAVEIESRVPKQVRGALMDLILHPYPKKLLLILPAHTGSPKTIATQAREILGRFVDANAFRVVNLEEDIDQTILEIRAALRELGLGPTFRGPG